MVTHPPPERSHAHLAVAVDVSLVPRFFVLLQQGVQVRRRVGCRVDAFLREELGAPQETVERIQSVMLDGRPVDDIATAVVLDGSTLALSAALPGLVGATLRRGGAYCSFRSGITHREETVGSAPGPGWVTVKLFNLIMAELGPGLLRERVLVRTRDLLGLLDEHAEDLRQGGGRVTLDGNVVDARPLRQMGVFTELERVLLSVSPHPVRGARKR